MNREQLLAEVEDIIRTMPSRTDFERIDDDLIPWVGRAVAAIARWDIAYSVSCDHAVNQLRSSYYVAVGFAQLSRLLYQARADLRMEVGQLSTVVQGGDVFEYFDELRKIIETARTEVLFVDPYLDAEFVSRYLPHVADSVTIRLLGGPKRMATLLPAVDMFARQSKGVAQVRSSTDLHDRYLFVDRSACYLSGASFKDGAKTAPAVLTQITDAFQAMWDTYDSLWNTAVPQR